MKKLLYVFVGLLIFGCATDNNTQEETLALVQENNAITQELERLITMDDNDIAGKKKRFKNRFGKINYDNAHIYDDQGGSTLYPITKKNTITHWLVGYYQDGKIKFKIRKIDFDKEESVTLYKKGKMVFINKVGTYVNKKATTASKGCSVTYRKVCSYYDANENGTHDPDVDSNLVCSYYFNGIECDLPVMDAEDDPSLPTWNDTGLGGGGDSSTCGPGYIRDENGNCLLLPKVIDSLTGKTKCVYDKLKAKNGNLFKKTIGKFIKDPKYNLILKNGNCGSTNDACTNARNLDTNGEITITIEDDTQSGLGISALILHEGIHAEIHRFVSRYESGVDPNNRPRLFQLYAFYKGYASKKDDKNYNWVNDAHHIYMVENYVNQIARAVRELDNNKYPLSHYMAYGWDGLTLYGYTTKRLTTNQNTQNQNLRAIANVNSTICE